MRFGQAAVELATQLRSHDIVAHALNNMGSVSHRLDLNSARELLSRSLELALENDLQEHVARAYTNLGWILINWRVHDEAEAILSTGIGYCIRTRSRYVAGLHACLAE